VLPRQAGLTLTWQPSSAFGPSAQHESFGDLADKILAMLTAQQPAQPVVSAEAEAYALPAERRLAALAAAHEAGRALGQVRADAYGDPVRAVSAPEGSRTVQRLRAWESKRRAS
jgi:hypothetical protein